jgi:biopolymer transport protein ExbD
MAIVFKQGDLADDAMLSEINTTPLVDVMLVLLIIFLITVPVINTSVVVRLPRQANQLQQGEAQAVLISVDALGGIYWYDSRIQGMQTLAERLREVAAHQPQPPIHIRGDARADYAAVARVLQAAQAAGLARVGFVTEPPGASGRGD